MTPPEGTDRCSRNGGLLEKKTRSCLAPPAPSGLPSGLDLRWVLDLRFSARLSDTHPDYSPGETSPTAPVHAPPRRSPTTVRSSPIAGADSAAASATPDSLLSNGAPSPPRCPSPDACPVCLCELPSYPEAQKHRSTILHWPHCGHALPTSLPMSAIYVAPLAVLGGRPKRPMHSPRHAVRMASRRHSLPRTTTPRSVSTYALKVRFTRGTQMYRTGAGAIHCPSGVARAFAFALPRRRDVFSCFA